jgi:hypothetical protein
MGLNVWQSAPAVSMIMRVWMYIPGEVIVINEAILLNSSARGCHDVKVVKGPSGDKLSLPT